MRSNAGSVIATLDEGNRPERMGGTAKPLAAFPWIWADDMRIGGGARIRIVCGHCDRGIVLPPDVKWGPPERGQLVASLKSYVAQRFVLEHQVCEHLAARQRIRDLGLTMLGRTIRPGTVLTLKKSAFDGLG